MKRILVVTYSQSGQITRILESLLAPLRQCADIDVTVETLRPTHRYPFPWPLRDFFHAIPECVVMDPPDLEPFDFDPQVDFDLIILGYQVWFLSPSLPFAGFLRSDTGAEMLAGKPVITVIGCRDMWVVAQEKVKKVLEGLNADLIDNVVLTDHRSGLGSIINTPIWVLTGKRLKLGHLPEPGVAEQDIDDARRFGEAIRDGLRSGAVAKHQTLFKEMGAVTIDPRLIVLERLGSILFRGWATLGRLTGPQGSLARDTITFPLGLLFPCLILAVAPPVILGQHLLLPWLRVRMEEQADRHSQPSGRARGGLSGKGGSESRGLKSNGPVGWLRQVRASLHRE